jgi:hypothetical protein
MEASELSSKAAQKAAEAVSSGGGIFAALRWIHLMAMMVLIRFLACRCCTLLDIRLSHVLAVDDGDSPLGAVLRIFIPKQKADPLGSNGGAAMRAVSLLDDCLISSHVFMFSPFLVLVVSSTLQ